MKKIFIAAALLFAAPAFAQDMEYNLRVTPTELNALGAAINELPKKIADPLLAKLTAQVQEQNAAAKKAEDAKKAAADANGTPAKPVEPAKK